VLVVMELGGRRILHGNTTPSPTAEWTTQQLREAIPCDHAWRFLVHDRDSIFSRRLDETLRHMGLRVLKAPARAPQANAFCERLIGTLRRECLDWLIPLSGADLRRILGRWVRHYNEARPHAGLGPGIPDPGEGLPAPLQPHRHRLPPGSRVARSALLGGLHHE
jgi:putative transposase